MFSQSVYNRIQTYEHYLWSQADTIKNSSSVFSTDSLLSTVELPPPNRRNTWKIFEKNLISELSDRERSEDLPNYLDPESDEIRSDNDPVYAENERSTKA